MLAETLSRHQEGTRHALGGRLVGRSPALQRRREAAARRPTVDELPLAVAAEPVQLRRLDGALTRVHREVARRNHELYGDAVPSHFAVRREARGAEVEGDERAVHAAAARGVSGAGGALPYVDVIQRAFGRHDVRGVQAHVGGAARVQGELAARSLGGSSGGGGSNLLGHRYTSEEQRANLKKGLAHDWAALKRLVGM
ncbi:MAG: hypothetical protein CVU56_29660 [Deltaproteobacteria bacterium HGW-Deltaproteobacteria-14]|nr:MAG: hypothetical protein CVU56_29660 [Deltaproteobacteria bacterium HGW-Deltaproteobacteria-14]